MRTTRASLGARLCLLALLVIAGASVSGCGGKAASCPFGEPLVAADWRAGLRSLDEAIGLAAAGDGRAASDLFFATGHDFTHRAVVTSCPQDRGAAKALSSALDEFHLDFVPEDARLMQAELSRIRELHLAAARAAEFSLD